MKIIEEKEVLVENLSNCPLNNYKRNPVIVEAIANDMRINGQQEAVVGYEHPIDSGKYCLTSGGGGRLPAFPIANKLKARIQIRQYADDFEKLQDILSFGMRRVKCEYDKAMEFDIMRTLLNRKSGERTDLSKEATGKTVDIIANKYPEKINGDKVGKYLKFFDNKKEIFDLIEKDVLSIATADDLIDLIKEEGRDVNEMSFTDIAEFLCLQFDGKEYNQIDDLDANAIEEVIKKYSRKYTKEKNDAAKERRERKQKAQVEKKLPGTPKPEILYTKDSTGNYQQFTEMLYVKDSTGNYVPY